MRIDVLVRTWFDRSDVAQCVNGGRLARVTDGIMGILTWLPWAAVILIYMRTRDLSQLDIIIGNSARSLTALAALTAISEMTAEHRQQLNAEVRNERSRFDWITVCSPF